MGLALAGFPTRAVASPAWSLVTSPNGGTKANLLPGVSCLSASACLAVGYFEDHNLVRQTLVESWNGTAWSIVPSPNQGSKNNELNAASCVSLTWCQAVGDYDNGSGATQTLVEFWNGSTWAIIPSPDQGTASNGLSNVTCISTMWCTAVGSFVDSAGVTQSLIEIWNGTAWSIVSSPDEASHSNFLDNLSCDSTTWCVAAGYYETGAATTQTLVESWNGTAWSIVPTPDSGTGSNALLGVSCTSPVSCTAVGYDVPTSPVVPGGIHAMNLVESWDGTAWSINSSPEEGTESNNFFDVSCVSPATCVAVGSYYEGRRPSVSKTLVESWNGTSWTVVQSPDFGRTKAINLLLAVSCVPSGFCATVGYHNVNTRTKTLVETLPLSTSTTSLSAPTTTTTPPTPPPTSLSGASPPTSAMLTAPSSTLAFTGTGNATRWVTLLALGLVFLGLALLALVGAPRRLLVRLGYIRTRQREPPSPGYVTDRLSAVGRKVATGVTRGARWLLGR